MIGVIGGTGLSDLWGDEDGVSELEVETPYGPTSAPIQKKNVSGRSVLFLPRHGHPHRLPPHKVNYRANIFALKQAGVEQVIAVNAVGGIHEQLGPEGIAIPDQIIDYTYGREHTFYDGSDVSGLATALDHVDFTYPYAQTIRNSLIEASRKVDIPVLEQGVYAATQGPRLESAAEIRKYAKDGADMVGMTGMPEAGLARELGIEYGCVAFSVNWCAGLTDDLITMEEIQRALDGAMEKVRAILFEAIRAE